AAPSGIIWYLRYQMPMLGTHSTYPKVAVQWLSQALCIYQSFCLFDSPARSRINFVLRNRHLRVAANRYRAFKRNTITYYETILLFDFYHTNWMFGVEDRFCC